MSKSKQGISARPGPFLNETQSIKKARKHLTDDQCLAAYRCPSSSQGTGKCKFPKVFPQRDQGSFACPSPVNASSVSPATKNNLQLKQNSIDLTFSSVRLGIPVSWQTITADNLLLEYALLFPEAVATELFDILEEEVEYFTGDLARVKVFGKWHNIPRKQATYGDPGLTYTYSGVCTPARPWPSALLAVRDLLGDATGTRFNFVLVNRYKDGKDKMGEHKDDEKELDPHSPIASVSLGQPRAFYFRHQDDRNKKRSLPKVHLTLEHGSVLLMRPPTNQHWYHALPPRAAAHRPRINLTFRSIRGKTA